MSGALAEPSHGPAAPAAPATVAVFDFDGTITNGGSGLPFLVTYRGLLPVAAAVLRTLPKLIRAGLFNGASADDAKEMLFTRLLGGRRAREVETVGSAFGRRHVTRRLRPEVAARMDWHRARGHRLVIISASPELYVAPAAEVLDVHDVLATRLAVDGSGRMTGHYEGLNCRGAEKYARLTGWLRANGLAGNGAAQPTIWAYGNSRGDLRLLQSADHAVDVGRLGRLGRLRRYPSLAAVAQASPASQPRTAVAPTIPPG